MLVADVVADVVGVAASAAPKKLRAITFDLEAILNTELSLFILRTERPELCYFEEKNAPGALVGHF